jgi:hypothetical protein
LEISKAATPQRSECCPQCPFARTTSKEYLDTRGDNAARFIGQALINALLPCHMESSDQNATVGEGRQCAGAAKFRSNLGVVLHPAIGFLPPDEDTVFADEHELFAHHKGLDVDPNVPSMTEVDQMAIDEFNKAILLGRYAT